MNDFQDKRKIEILGGQCLNAAVQIYNTRTCGNTVIALTDADFGIIFDIATRMLRKGKDVGWLDAIQTIANEEADEIARGN